jgi:PAS domain S-box-containing protein
VSHSGLALANAYGVQVVTLSIFMAIASAYTATILARNAASAPKKERNFWLAGTAAVIGVGIWATRFILDGAATDSFLGVGMAAVIVCFLTAAAVTAIADKRVLTRALRRSPMADKEPETSATGPHVVAIYQASPDGTLLDLNEACAKMLGYGSRDEARRANLRGHFADPAEFTTLLRNLETHGKVTSRELRFLKKDGTTLRVLQNASFIHRGRPTSKVIQATFTDITGTQDIAETNDPASTPSPSDLLALSASLRLAANSVLVPGDHPESKQITGASVEHLEADAEKSEPAQPSTTKIN